MSPRTSHKGSIEASGARPALLPNIRGASQTILDYDGYASALKSSLRNGYTIIESLSTVELSRYINEVIALTKSELGEVTVLQFYKGLVRRLPKSLPTYVLERLIHEMHSDDKELAESALNALFYLNVKSIVSFFEHYNAKQLKLDDSIFEYLLKDLKSHLSAYDQIPDLGGYKNHATFLRIRARNKLRELFKFNRLLQRHNLPLVERDRLAEMAAEILNKDEAEVVVLKFGLDGSEPKNSMQIRSELQVSDTKYSKLMQKALAKLREALNTGDQTNNRQV